MDAAPTRRETPMPASSTKRNFTVDEANRMLPLVRAIVRDMVGVIEDMRHVSWQMPAPGGEKSRRPDAPEPRELTEKLDALDARLQELGGELEELGVEFKGADGLVDFPARYEGRDIHLCWKLGEQEVAWWHDVEAGFSGRQPITTEMSQAIMAQANRST